MFVFISVGGWVGVKGILVEKGEGGEVDIERKLGRGKRFLFFSECDFVERVLGCV